MGHQPMPDQEVKKVCKRWEKKACFYADGKDGIWEGQDFLSRRKEVEAGTKVLNWLQTVKAQMTHLL